MRPTMVPYRLQRQGALPEQCCGAEAMKGKPLRASISSQGSGEHSPTSVTCASSAFDSDSSDTDSDQGQDPIPSRSITRASPLLAHVPAPPKPLQLAPLTEPRGTEITRGTGAPGPRSSGGCLSPAAQRVTGRPRLERKAKSWGSELKFQPYAALSRAEWERAFEAGGAGRLRNGGRDVVRRVRLGGCEGALRAEVWPFLLGLYSFSSTQAEREVERGRREAGFQELRRQAKLASRCAHMAEAHQRCAGEEAVTSNEGGGSQGSEGSETPSWKELTRDLPEDFRSTPGAGEGGLAAFTVWRRSMRLDAVRVNDQWIPHSSQGVPDADRTQRLVQEAGIEDWEHLSLEQQVHAARLVRILEAYAVHDPLIGYCQGMTDLLSPFVALIESDGDAFWCFARFMESARHNFRTDEVGIRRQLDAVSDILASCDPQLYRQLGKAGAKDCLFAYRMVVVLLRRELSFEDTVSLWEVLWAETAAAASEASAAPAASAFSWDSTPPSPCAGAGAPGPGSLCPAQPDFFLYTVAAVIVSQRKAILECEELDEVLCSCTNLVGKIDVWHAIALGRGLVSMASWRAQL